MILVHKSFAWGEGGIYAQNQRKNLPKSQADFNKKKRTKSVFGFFKIVKITFAKKMNNKLNNCSRIEFNLCANE